METTPLLSRQDIQSITQAPPTTYKDEVNKILKDMEKDAIRYGFATGFYKEPMQAIDLEGLSSKNELLRIPAMAYAKGYKIGREYAYKKTGSGTKKSRKTRRHSRK